MLRMRQAGQVQQRLLPLATGGDPRMHSNIVRNRRHRRVIPACIVSTYLVDLMALLLLVHVRACMCGMHAETLPLATGGMSDRGSVHIG
jgi:hypothetical protein